MSHSDSNKPASSAASSSLSTIDPAKLPTVAELQTNRLQVEKELDFLSSSHSQLVDAKAKCMDNITIIDHLGKMKPGQEMLVGITSSMFLPVALKHNDLVMTDIGTGFLVERERDDAKAFYRRKIDTVNESVRLVETGLLNKQNALKFLSEALRIKAEAEQSK